MSAYSTNLLLDMGNIKFLFSKKIKSRYFMLLFLVFLLGLFIRFVNFNQSIYFGYDEARDAYDSIATYQKGDLKISGPPASAFKGINHGPFYLYFIGPLFLIGNGDPYLASAVFRIINAFGIFLVAFLVDYFFGKPKGLLAALIYAFSFEQHQYAIFTGNPALSNSFWPVMFLGAALAYKSKKYRLLGLLLMLLSASFIAQFDLILSYSFLTLVILLILMRKKLKNIKKTTWLKIVLVGLIPVYTYPLAELINKFLGVKTLLGVLSGVQITHQEGESAFTVAMKNFGGLFADNIIKFEDVAISTIFALGVVLYLLIKRKENFFNIAIAIWCASLFFLIIARGFMPFYSYAGVGIGMIIGASLILYMILKRNKLAFLIFTVLIIFSNLTRIVDQSKKGLIVQIKAQPGMLLTDQIRIVQKTYEFAEFKGFTIRTTSMPYKVQTVWAYLYDQYGYKKYGYLPYLEGGNTLGYPGTLPEPMEGVTCSRVLIREPVRGIPEHLIVNDQVEENLFSTVVKEEKIGEFVVQFRKSIDPDCHNKKGMP